MTRSHHTFHYSIGHQAAQVQKHFPPIHWAKGQLPQKGLHWSSRLHDASTEAASESAIPAFTDNFHQSF